MIGPRKVEKPLVLYGKLGHLAEEIFKELRIPTTNIDKNKHWQDIPNFDSLLAICVATEPYLQVIKPLIAAGWTDIVPVWDIIEAYPEVGLHNGWVAGPLTQEDRAGMGSITLRLADKESITHYFSHVEWSRYREEMDYKVEERETLPSTLADIRRRQYVWYLEGNGAVDIHCEGHELDTLKVNMRLFQEHRPNISCACYHSRDGLWNIEKLLMDNLPDYTWKFKLSAFMGQGAYISGSPIHS
jgi:hypothetical protein